MDTRINAVGLVAADLKATLGFYERLGCTFTIFPGDGHASADLGGFELMVDSAASMETFGLADAAPQAGPRPGFALAVKVDSPADVDALYAELDAAGHGLHQPFDAPWGQRYATVTDPDGTKVDIHCWLPGRAPTA
jgi:catechol 2,3-dioxygenase-like lactoylglutathione lyase family enzyme